MSAGLSPSGSVTVAAHSSKVSFCENRNSGGTCSDFFPYTGAWDFVGSDFWADLTVFTRSNDGVCLSAA